MMLRRLHIRRAVPHVERYFRCLAFLLNYVVPPGPVLIDFLYPLLQLALIPPVFCKSTDSTLGVRHALAAIAAAICAASSPTPSRIPDLRL
jgi:hypothetical protein